MQEDPADEQQDVVADHGEDTEGAAKEDGKDRMADMPSGGGSAGQKGGIRVGAREGQGAGLAVRTGTFVWWVGGFDLRPSGMKLK